MPQALRQPRSPPFEATRGEYEPRVESIIFRGPLPVSSLFASLPVSHAAPAKIKSLPVPRQKMPRHIAVIMDGNGRWAQRQNLPRIVGVPPGEAMPLGLVMVDSCEPLGTVVDSRQNKRCAGEVDRSAVEEKKGSRLFDVTPCDAICRRQDLNLHWVNPNQALNLARLPIPPLRRGRLPLYLMRMPHRKSSPNPTSSPPHPNPSPPRRGRGVGVKGRKKTPGDLRGLVSRST